MVFVVYTMEVDFNMNIYQILSWSVMECLKVRENTFSLATPRYQNDYVNYEEPGVFVEDPLSFYSNNCLVSWSKKYDIDKIESESINFCNKTFPPNKAFAGGTFSIGCPCKNNLTLALQIMERAESSRFFFNSFKIAFKIKKKPKA